MDLVAIPVLAAEAIPPDSPLAMLAVPLGILIFLGSIYLLLRANLGTRRGYLVLGTSFFGFIFIMSLFWGFGAPGTPQATGPANLPGQQPDAYVPHWVPFAETSRLADRPEYQFVTENPDRFGPVPPEFEEEAESGIDSIRQFFAEETSNDLVGGIWEAVETEYAVADNGFPVLRVTYQEVDEQSQEVVEDGETVTLYGFFDGGAEIFPSLVIAGVALLFFLLHIALLDRDEQRERQEARGTPAGAEAEQERVPAGA